jgi:RNase P subunit RPR2
MKTEAPKTQPICKYCKKPMSPSGGTVGLPENEREYSWTCWNCDYTIECVPCEVLEGGVE